MAFRFDMGVMITRPDGSMKVNDISSLQSQVVAHLVLGNIGMELNQFCSGNYTSKILARQRLQNTAKHLRRSFVCDAGV